MWQDAPSKNGFQSKRLESTSLIFNNALHFYKLTIGFKNTILIWKVPGSQLNKMEWKVENHSLWKVVEYKGNSNVTYFPLIAIIIIIIYTYYYYYYYYYYYD